MSNGICISVIMPAFNAEKYLKEAIESVLAQTYSLWELIVIDDDSRDATAEIVREYQKQDSRVRYLKNKTNSGVSESRNRGVREAKGQWIAFLDSDDRWTPEKLERQLSFAEQHNARFAFTGSGFIDDDGRALSYYLSVPMKISYRQLLKQNLISCSSVLIRKELMLKNPMPSGDMHEDFAAWLGILKTTGVDAYGLDQPLLLYRVSPQSKSGNKRKAAKMTYRVYRYIGLSVFEAGYYWVWYAVRSLRKYRGIRGK